MSINKQAMDPVTLHAAIAGGVHATQNVLTGKLLTKPSTYHQLIDSMRRGISNKAEHIPNATLKGLVSPELLTAHREAYDLGKHHKRSAVLLRRMLENNPEKVARLAKMKGTDKAVENLTASTGLPIRDMLNKPEFLHNYVSNSKHPVVSAMRDAARTYSPGELTSGSKLVTPHVKGSLASAAAFPIDPVASTVNALKIAASSRPVQKIPGSEKLMQAGNHILVKSPFQSGVNKATAGRPLNKALSAAKATVLSPIAANTESIGHDIATHWKNSN